MEMNRIQMNVYTCTQGNVTKCGKTAKTWIRDKIKELYPKMPDPAAKMDVEETGSSTLPGGGKIIKSINSNTRIETLLLGEEAALGTLRG